jgi:hypothetical protein
MEIEASAASNFMLVARPVHPPLTLLHLTLLLWQIHKMMKETKKVEKRKKMMSEAFRKPSPTYFWVLDVKGGEK